MADEGTEPTTSAHRGSPFVTGSPEWRRELPGHHIIWNVEGVPPWEGLLAGMSGSMESYSLAGFRTARHGGPHEADFAVHRVLINLLGAIALTSGQIEIEMKRILLVAKAEPKAGFADVDLTWKDLEDALADVATGDGELAGRLRPVLTWSDEKRLRDRRNDAIHSAWTTYEIGHLEGARIARKADAYTIMDGIGGQGLAETVEDLRSYLNQLQKVVQWPIMVLPPLPADAPIRRLQFDISSAKTDENT